MKDKIKRYTATIDLYIYAKDDQEAYNKSKEVVEVVQELDDNRASIISIDEVPYGRPLIKKLELSTFQ